MIFGLERSSNGIYDRIVLELVRGFSEFGHQCVVINPTEITSLNQVQEIYQNCDWVIVTNNNNLLSQKIGGIFLFELFKFKTIFLHHDALSHNSNDLGEIREKIDALVRICDRSIHFSIEKRDVSALNDLGLSSHPIAHINTLGNISPGSDLTPRAELSFIGHATPPVNAFIAFGFNDQEYYNSYQSRLSDFTYAIRDRLPLLGENDGTLISADFLSRRVQYLLFTNYYTMWLRGAVLEQLTNCQINLYGGDPSWMHGVEPSRLFTGDRIITHKPVYDTAQVANIFQQSLINLNITSLQFDSALINRVVDGFSAGGFVLTDHKDQLYELTTCAGEISYKTIDELQVKIDYFSSPSARGRRLEIIHQVQHDFSINCSIERTVEMLLQQINSSAINY